MRAGVTGRPIRCSMTRGAGPPQAGEGARTMPARGGRAGAGAVASNQRRE